MPVEENIKLMRRWFHEVWNEGKIETVHELLSPNCVAHGQRGTHTEITGPKGFEAFVHEIRSSFPAIKVQIEDIFGADDKVVVRWSAAMPHTVDAPGLPATGKTVRIGGASIARFVEGKIVEGWDHWDQLGLLEQIGAYKPPAPPSLPKSA